MLDSQKTLMVMDKKKTVWVRLLTGQDCIISIPDVKNLVMLVLSENGSLSVKFKGYTRKGFLKYEEVINGQARKS